MNILLLKASCLSGGNSAVTQPLGLMYLASYLREKNSDEHNIRLTDLRLFPQPAEKTDRILKQFIPDVVGISALTMEAPLMHFLAQRIKKQYPNCKIVSGGPHATTFGGKILKDTNIDCVIQGEGEITFSEVISAFKNGEDLSKVKGILYRQEDKIVQPQKRDFISSLDTIPHPAWDLIDVSAYKKINSLTPLGFRNYMSIFTSRGCPYKCIYCHNIFGKKYRVRSVENVIEEIELLYTTYGIRNFDMLDDNFNLHIERAEQICDEIIKRGYDIKLSFPNGLRTDLLNKKILKKMKKAGTCYIGFAIETTSKRLQALVKKNLDIQKVKELIAYAAELKILTNGFFMIGFPTETEQEANDTISFAVNSKLHLANFFSVTPFEGTELYSIYQKKNKDTSVDFTKYNYLVNNFNLTDIEEKKFSRLQGNAYLRFYFRPIRILRILNIFFSMGKTKNLLYYFFKVISFSKRSHANRPLPSTTP